MKENNKIEKRERTKKIIALALIWGLCILVLFIPKGNLKTYLFGLQNGIAILCIINLIIDMIGLRKEIKELNDELEKEFMKMIVLNEIDKLLDSLEELASKMEEAQKEEVNSEDKQEDAEPKKAGERGKSSNAPAMIIFCAFEQMQMVIEEGKKHELMKSYPLIFVKNFSAQVLKANMKVVNACEYAVVLYRDKLPKFRNIGVDGKGHMVFNWFEWERDGKDVPKIHPTQKPVNVLKKLIEIFTDEGDVVIDPVAGSGSTLRACMELNRSRYGFEIKKNFYKEAKEKMLKNIKVQQTLF